MRNYVQLVLILLPLSSGATSVYDHISANKEQINEAHCQETAPKRSSSYYKKIIEETRLSDTKLTRSIGGLTVKDESEKLIAGYRYLTSHLDYKLRPIQDIDYWHTFKDGQCKDVSCAAAKVFGQEKGNFFLGFLIETGLNLSSLGYSKLEPPTFSGETEPSPETIAEFNGLYKVRPWEEEELTGYLQGVYSLPKFLFPLTPTRLAQSTHFHQNGPQVHSNATIIMYPDMVSLDVEYQRYTMVHEIGHVIGAHLRLDTSPEWVAYSWKLDRQNNRVLRKTEENFVSAYARQDFFEDFAESFAAFRFNPKKLLNKAPGKFNFIKERIFKGLDYLQEDHCQD